jgi:hypothetical protein
MAQAAEFDVLAAHRYFSGHCFNRAWDLIEKPGRTPEEDLLMVALNQASIFHWLNRPDCDRKRLSVGYWQASRIQAILGNAQEALRQAEVCLSYSGDLEPFYRGYAHEALARAAAVSGDNSSVAKHVALARAEATLVEPEEDREALLKDLAGLA